MSNKGFELRIMIVFSLSGCFGGSDKYIRIHDPSTVRKFDGKYMTFSTTGGNEDKGIKSRFYSFDKKKWLAGEDILLGINTPKWLKKLYPNNRGKFWAPDLPYSDKKIIYYSNWSFSGQDGVASIGRAVGSGIAPDITWTDDDKPVISTDKYTYDNGGPCAIDPAVFEDYAGNLWLSFGSHGLENSPGYGGIWIVRLDPKTGHIPIGTDPIWSPGNKAFTQLANYGDSKYTENNIEAPFVYKFEGYYYLFVNWDRCCNGIESDYQILVGRSKLPEGPYFDRAGKNLVDGGGTLVLESKGKYIGPGHAGIFKDEKGVFCFSFHYYDGQDNGRAKLGLRKLVWEDDWPIITDKTYELMEFEETSVLPPGLTRPPH